MHEEALLNQRIAKRDLALYDNATVWLLQLQRGVDEARATHGKASFVYPPRPDGLPDSPGYAAYTPLSSEAWTTAHTSSLMVLLPNDLSRVYESVYIQIDQALVTRQKVRDSGALQGAFETRFSEGSYPPQFELSRLTPQQLDTYEGILTDELESVRLAQARLHLFPATNDYVASGGLSREAIHGAALKANMPHSARWQEKQ